MAEPLKNSYGPAVPRRIGAMLQAVHPAFALDAFLQQALDGYEALALMPRARHIAAALHHHLPADFAQAVDILLASLDEPLQKTEGNGLGSFLYLPHTMFVAQHGLGHFEDAMRAQHALTQRFTAEFSIRPFLEHHPEATLARLAEWTRDPSEHVRRLVSEGSRPRLPWAPRLRRFQDDPRPVLPLLQALRDDPSPYVRRSVANHLNDIGKDHPQLLIDTATAWLQQAPPERERLVRHALRVLVKQGNPQVLALLGHGAAAQVQLEEAVLSPASPRIGGQLQLDFVLRSTAVVAQDLLVDFRVHYLKANGRASPKVFKLKTLGLAAGERAVFSKRLSLAQMSTRQHLPGLHRVELLVNGAVFPLGDFVLQP